MVLKNQKRKSKNLLTRSNPQAGLQHRQSLDLQVREVNEDERRVTVSFSSEEPYTRYFGVEILQHDKSSVDITRLQEIGVSLFNHNRDMVIGRIENVKLDESEKRAYADIVFDDDEDTEKIYKKVKSGTLKGVSVGYSVDCWEEVKPGKKSSNGRFEGPAWIATKWTPMEVSIVSVPADGSVGVGREIENTNIYSSSDDLERGNQMLLRELCKKYGLDYDALVEQGMSDDQVKSVIESLQKRDSQELPTPAAKAEKAAIESIDTDAAKREAAAAERTRTLEITEMCRELDVDSKEYIEKGTSVDAVRTALFEKMKAERSPLSGANIRVGEAEEDKVRNAMTDAILMRGGTQLDKPAAGANDFRGMRLRDMAIECLVRAGVSNAHRLSDESLLKKALSPDSQFSALATNAVSKSLAVSNANWQPSYKSWTGVGSNRDFRGAKHYQLSEAGSLEKVAQNGEIKSGEMSDLEINKAVATYGKKWGLTRQAIINDDIDMLVRMPIAYSMAALRTVNELVYTILGNNSKIYDGTSLFTAAHKNKAASGSALSSSSVSAGMTAMMTQKGLKGEQVLNIVPKFLIVPANLHLTANQLYASSADPSGAHSGVANPYAGSLQPIVEGSLDGKTSGANGWFLASDPNQCDNIEVTYLNGQDTPVVESQVAFDTLGVNFRIYLDAGVTATDFKGLYFNAGA